MGCPFPNIVAETHDIGIAPIGDGVAALVLEEERFNREKHREQFRD